MKAPLSKTIRALRRFHSARVKANYKAKLKQSGFFMKPEGLERAVCLGFNNRARCSCFMCGNYRANKGNSKSGKTIQELRLFQDLLYKD